MSKSVLLNNPFDNKPSVPAATTSQGSTPTTTTTTTATEEDTTCIWEPSTNTNMSTESTSAVASTPDDVATEMMRTLMQTLETLPVNDGSFTPKQFTGSPKDIANVDKWLDYFSEYTKFRCLSPDRQLQLFKLLLTEQAADWLRALPQTVKDDMESLVDAFKQRFAQNELHRWQNASSMWTRQQHVDESVETFITAVKNLARLVPITDEEQIKFAVLKGMRKEIKMHVLQTDPKTLDDVIRAARIAEMAFTSTGTDNQVADLTKQVSQLVDQLKKSTVNAVQTPSRSRTPSPRRVHFDDRPERSSAGANIDSNLAAVRRQPHQQSSEYLPRESRRADSYRRTDTNHHYTSADRGGQSPTRNSFYSRQPSTTAPYNCSRPQPELRTNRSGGGDRRCGNCGEFYCYEHTCRAVGKPCFCCRKTGHFAKVCRHRPQVTSFSNRMFNSNRQH